MSIYNTTLIFNLLIQFIMIIFYFSKICTSKYSEMYAYITSCGLAVIVEIISYYISGSVDNTAVTVCRNIILLLVLFFMFEGKILKKIITYLLMFLLSAFSMIGVPLCNLVFDTGKIGFDYSTMLGKALYPALTMVSQCIYFIVLLTAAIIYRKGEFVNIHTISSIIMLYAFPVFYIFYTLILYNTFKERITPAVSLIQNASMMALFIIFIIQYNNTEKIYKYYKLSEKYQKQEAEKKATYDYYVMANEKFTEVSEIRHDIKNMVLSAEALIDSKNMSEAAEILKGINVRLDSTKAVNYCDNKLIDTVLNVIINKPENKDINFDILLKDTNLINIDSYDLCSIFSNIIDNACEAARECNSGNKYVKIRSGQMNGIFVLRAENTYNPQKSDVKKFNTTKSSDGHGYGTKIIANLKKKYNIRLKYDIDNENNIFTVKMLFMSDMD